MDLKQSSGKGLASGSYVRVAIAGCMKTKGSLALTYSEFEIYIFIEHVLYHT